MPGVVWARGRGGFAGHRPLDRHRIVKDQRCLEAFSQILRCSARTPGLSRKFRFGVGSSLCTACDNALALRLMAAKRRWKRRMMLITRSKLLSVPKTSRAMVAKRTRETHVPVGEGMQPGTMRTESPSKQGWYLFSPIGNRYGLTVVGLAKLISRAQGPGLEHPMQGRSGNLASPVGILQIATTQGVRGWVRRAT
jgi:hypothetical protein